MAKGLPGLFSQISHKKWRTCREWKRKRSTNRDETFEVFPEDFARSSSARPVEFQIGLNSRCRTVARAHIDWPIRDVGISESITELLTRDSLRP
ncbi:hypothetical protein Tco_0875955 [Tanacetum coccineum]|uniref:Uncharacterized protein n=1 Tax=Tanacetum coccineum TaxID=301880 RepID=A0ABQ5BVX4_9ASTR